MLTASEIRKALGIPPSVPEFTMTGDEEVPKEEEWVWVDGYKGTNANMMCRDFQYELGKRFDMPEDAEIDVCISGFHLCTKLADVYDYYHIGDGNRFFKVRALVRKDEYAKAIDAANHNVYFISLYGSKDSKLAAKSIEFIEELTPDTILKGYRTDGWTDEDKLDAITHSIGYVNEKYKKIEQEKQKQTLVDLGYSEAFVSWLISEDKYGIAYAVGTQKDLSMDVKVLTILHDDD